jgi:hypothetical protein
MTLDVGCGRNKHPAAIGIDRNRDTNADVFAISIAYPTRSGKGRSIKSASFMCFAISATSVIEPAGLATTHELECVS